MKRSVRSDGIHVSTPSMSLNDMIMKLSMEIFVESRVVLWDCMNVQMDVMKLLVMHPIVQMIVEEKEKCASLGQVYRAKIRGQEEGEEDRRVAVKVQRPNIMNQIALDMHLIRDVAPFIKRTFNLNTDFVGVVDTWGVGFVDELDYIEEAINAKTFMESIEQTPLSGVVFSPPVVDELTTRKVLTTEWIVGERLDRSGQEDVSILCSIAMNTYLTMMLETGVLHCDP
jgi:predicted unusual protein kinase regulating ubiquinone biosynthesis (AarF/ABC1/UbiB family)